MNLRGAKQQNKWTEEETRQPPAVLTGYCVIQSGVQEKCSWLAEDQSANVGKWEQSALEEKTMAYTDDQLGI